VASALDNAGFMGRSVYMSGLVGVLLWACAPALDWREVRPAGGGIELLMPCKPDSHARQVRLGPDTLRLELHACSAAGTTWALAFGDVGDPARVGPALLELQASAARNLSAGEPVQLPLKAEGATPNPASRRVQFQGHMPDGRAVTEQVAVFAKGTRVYQAVALGAALDAEAVDGFFASLRLAP
jgi:hypothetical protein